MAKLYYQGHGSYRITASDGRVIYIDPFAGDGYEPPADIVLVTHQHGDHNKLRLVTQKAGCQVITNEEALAGGRHNRFEFDGIEIQAVMAKNLMHSPKKCVGYLIYLDGVKIYASGDTSKTEQMKEFAALKLDCAILCCDGKFNMGLKESAECAVLIGAKHNIPVHIAPGKLFDRGRAAKWKAPNRVILPPGGSIDFDNSRSKSSKGIYMNERALELAYCDNASVDTREGSLSLTKINMGLLNLPTGKIVANDPCCFYELDEFTTTVQPGQYPVSISIGRYPSNDKRVALAMIRFSDDKPIKWEMALVKEQSTENLKDTDDGYFGYGVDSGTGGFMDKQAADKICERNFDIYELFKEQFESTYVHTYNYAIGNIDGGAGNDVAAFSSGWGDGCYPSYFGFNESGEPCVLVTDFLILN